MRDKIFIIDKSDNRNVYLKRALEENGYLAFDYENAPQNFTQNLVYVFAPKTIIDIGIAKKLAPASTVFAFKIDSIVEKEFNLKNIKFINVVDDEIFAHKNAILTAEGALQIVISNTDVSLANCNVLILGFGRLGKCISKLFNAVGSNVTTVTTTFTEEILATVYMNTQSLTLATYESQIDKFNVIINTIPIKILTNNILKNVRSDALILDLASNPGGVDFDAATKHELKTIHALGLPAKAAPYDAGIVLMERIFRAL